MSILLPQSLSYDLSLFLAHTWASRAQASHALLIICVPFLELHSEERDRERDIERKREREKEKESEREREGEYVGGGRRDEREKERESKREREKEKESNREGNIWFHLVGLK